MSLSRLLSAATALVALVALAPGALAGLPEPDTVFYGTIAIDGIVVGAGDTGVTVELRQTGEGPAVSTYRMGDSEAAGDRYVLRARVESAVPLSDPTATPLGGAVHLVVKKDGMVRATRLQSITGRGTFVNLNFGEVDSDGDGMSDAFELAYFGSETAGNPNEDPDADGRPNRREYLQGTNPNLADGRHPADLTPADNRLDIREVTEYALAWKLGEPWTVEPLTIPADYVTRASALWVGGERYVFDNDPVTSAPLWWVNDPAAVPSGGTNAASAALSRAARAGARTAADEEVERASLLAAAGEARTSPAVAPGRVARPSASTASVSRTLPWNYQLHQPFRVTLTVTPDASTRAYAVEEAAPAGRLIRFVSEGGRFDSRNRLIKWGPFFGSGPRTLTYEVTPLDPAASVLFSGVGSFDGSSVSTDGRAAVYAPGVVPKPRIEVVLDDVSARLRLTGAPGQTYTVESSTDLGVWLRHEPVTTDPSGEAELPLVGQEQLRFFRLRP